MYGTTWVGPKFVWPLGGGWAVAFGVIEDQDGNRKLRMAKGRRTNNEAGGAPVKQGNKINFANVEQARDILTRALAALDDIAVGM